MKILIKNATLISMDENREKIEKNIDILIEKSIISKIGKNIKEKADKTIDASNKIIMPGLINTHAHISMSIFRETLEGYTLQEWLNKKIWPMEDKLTKEDIYYSSKLSCIEMIKTGTTTVNDMYFIAEETIKAALETKVRIQTTRTLIDTKKDGNEKIKELEDLIRKYRNKYDTITLNVGIHSFYTTNPEYIKKCVEISKKYNLLIHIHFCENKKEVEDIKKIYGVNSPVELIQKYFQGSHVILAHAVKISKEDIKKLTKQKIYISHCPISNLKLGCGIANIKELLENKVCVTLGTDGQGSGSSLDLFEVMKYTSLLQKGIQENPKVIPSYEVLKMATINGAKALNLDSEIGSIKEGKKADIIILNLEDVLTKPINNIFSQIVYNVKGTNVETVIINGEIIMENRKLKESEEKIYKKVEEIIKRIEI
ncbi:MAG: amidohydrolase [Clostridia bacterium]|jgi:5-methylthioadenosine/S-adenosylhomocysteine deaminase|nr:amidohydrolase [Clostridia bacterium]